MCVHARALAYERKKERKKERTENKKKSSDMCLTLRSPPAARSMKQVLLVCQMPVN